MRNADSFSGVQAREIWPRPDIASWHEAGVWNGVVRLWGNSRVDFRKTHFYPFIGTKAGLGRRLLNPGPATTPPPRLASSTSPDIVIHTVSFDETGRNLLFFSQVTGYLPFLVYTCNSFASIAPSDFAASVLPFRLVDPSTRCFAPARPPGP